MATEQAASELKQQGAMEASRDPASSVSAEDAERKVLEESRSAGVAAFKFDPDATPAEKKAQAKEVGRPSVLKSPHCGREDTGEANVELDRHFRTAFIRTGRRVQHS